MIPTCWNPNNSHTAQNRHHDRPKKQRLAPPHGFLLYKRKERRSKRLMYFVGVVFRAAKLELVALRYITGRKCDTGNNSLIESTKSFEHNLCPGLINCTPHGFRLGAKLKLCVGERQRVINRVYSLEQTDPSVHNGTGLKIEVSRTPGIEDLKSAALSLITKKLYQF